MINPIRLIIIVLLVLLSFSSFNTANGMEQTNEETQNHGTFTLGGSIRSRVEFWDWFEPGKNIPQRGNNYTFSGNILKLNGLYENKNTQSFVEFAVPFFIGLPDNAAAPPPQGLLGVGANYRVLNNDNFASIFLKQAYFKQKIKESGSIKLGRFEFSDGLEVLTGDQTLDWLKKTRIGERLIGTFGFTHIGRSFDGFEAKLDKPTLNATVFGALPTQGVFDLQGWKDFPDVRVLYTGVTKRNEAKTQEGRLFYIFYNDARDIDGLIKTDNRPLPGRLLDNKDLFIHTIGSHYIRKLGPFDLLGWGAIQVGKWGTLDHFAYAWDTELGFKPPKMLWEPWLRIGTTQSSGDNNPTNGSHGTFFQLLPTPRQYARFPFFNMMNIRDYFVQLIFKPYKKITTRLDFHILNMAEANDLWYIGGGAFRKNIFGYAGTPSGGHNRLANLLDLSIDYVINPKTNITFYIGHAIGQNIISDIYKGNRRGNFLYWEITRKF